MAVETRVQEERAQEPGRAPARGVSGRAVGLGLALLPLVILWIVRVEAVNGESFPTVLALLPPAVFSLFVLALLNQWLRARGWPGALTAGELVTVYSLVAVGASVAGCDVMQTLVMLMTVAHAPGNASRQWDADYALRLPSWSLVSDRQAVRSFYEGSTTLYLPAHYLPWILPVLCWMAFLVCLLLTVFCVNAILRRHWIQSERLSFPIMSLPLALARQDESSVFRSRLFWVGFGLVAVVDALNGAQFLVPSLPALLCKQVVDLGQQVPGRPWSAIGWTPVTFYPFGLGIGFLMPLDLAFSCWFFLWVWKAERVAAAALGYESAYWGGPFSQQQASGAWLGILALTLWTARRYLAETVKKALVGGRAAADREEPLSYRSAYLGLAAGFAGLFAFAVALGMAPGIAAAYLALYLGVCVVIARVRAETGPPIHDLYCAGPDTVLATAVGPQRMDASTLTGMTMFYWLNRESYRSQPMPHHMEGLKMASVVGTSARRLTFAVLAAGLVGGLLTFWLVLDQAYHFGVAARFRGPAPWFAVEGFTRLDNWVTSPPPRAASDLLATGFGFAFAVALLLLRQRFLSFPLHPIGYVIASAWAMNLLWCPIALAWLAKLLVLRYGGLRLYRQAVPLFMGAIAGEFVTGALWQLVGLAANLSTYSFFP